MANVSYQTVNCEIARERNDNKIYKKATDFNGEINTAALGFVEKEKVRSEILQCMLYYPFFVRQP